MKKRKAKESVVQRTAGIFKTNLPPLTERALKDAAEQAIADDVMERMERSTGRSSPRGRGVEGEGGA